MEKTSLPLKNFSKPVVGLAICQKNDSCIYVSKTASGKKISHLMYELFKKDAVFLTPILSTHVMKDCH